MSNLYPQLTYRGDVTGSEQAQPGHLLGCDEVGRFYEVIDAEFYELLRHEGGCLLAHPGQVCPNIRGCDSCGWVSGHTHVNLQYATPENIKRASAGGVLARD